MSIKLPRVAAVHDLSGFGKCALTVAIPVLSAAGVEVCPLPTALLSTNTCFKDFTFMDFTSYMDDYINHWKQIGLKFDCVYSGFLGSEAQIGSVLRLIKEFDSGISVIDPVMGDNGKLFKTYTDAMCKEILKLVEVADVVTPNITEACIITNREYTGAQLTREQSKAMCEEIIRIGAKNVVLTGVLRDDKLLNCGFQKDFGYFEKHIEKLSQNMHGTGDLFTSTLTAGLMRGYDLQKSVESAASFVFDAMKYSYDVENSFERGVAFEPLVHHLSSGIYNKL